MQVSSRARRWRPWKLGSSWSASCYRSLRQWCNLALRQPSTRGRLRLWPVLLLVPAHRCPTHQHVDGVLLLAAMGFLHRQHSHVHAHIPEAKGAWDGALPAACLQEDALLPAHPFCCCFVFDYPSYFAYRKWGYSGLCYLGLSIYWSLWFPQCAGKSVLT